MSDFSNTNPESSLSGYAKMGVTAKLSNDLKLTEIIGLEAMVYGQRNGIQTAEFEKQLSNTLFIDESKRYSNWEVKNG